MFLATIRSNPRGWFVVAVMFFALSFSFAGRMSLPVLIPGWADEFEWDRAFLSDGGALIMIVMGLVAPIGGNLLDRFGPRYLIAGGLVLSGVSIALTALMQEPWMFIVVFCIAAATGYGIVSVPIATTTVTRHFEKNRGLAVSVVNTGVGGGQAIFLPVLALAIVAVGWRPTLIVSGAVIAGFGILCIALLNDDRPARSGTSGRGFAAESLFARLSHVLRRPVFWLLAGAYVICGFTTAGVIKVHLVPYATICGFTLTEGASTAGLLALFDMVGLILSGYLTDRIHRPALLGTIYFLRALTFIMLFFVTGNFALLLVFAVLFGVLDFATVPPTSGLAASHLGLPTMGLTMGILFGIHSLGGAIGASLAGRLYDAYADYDWVWIAAIALALLAAVFAVSVPETRTDAPADAKPAAA